MCGIAGVVDRSTKFDPFSQKEVIHKMANLMAHRGPDDFGFYHEEGLVSMAHRRLSIIDLSPLGHQPMVNERFSMVFNGEVYNFQEIRKNLEREGLTFESQSDSEVVLKAYTHFGASCFSMFNGMFAVAFWDRLKKELILARDRMGIKPLYYTLQNKAVIFASEMKALFAHPDLQKGPNHDAIYNYLFLGHPLDDHTWFKNVFSVPAGSYMVFSQNTQTTHTFWQPRVEIDYQRSYKSFREELRATVIDAVRLHQISDVQVGAHLSGGIDSSTIVSIASGEFNNSLHTFSSTFQGLGERYDETDEIAAVQQRFGTTHHEIKTDVNQLSSLIPRLLYHSDEPIVGPAMIPMYFVNKAVRDEGVIVVNGGHGIDEMFGGYPPSFTHAAYSLLELAQKGKLLPSELIRIPSYLHKGGAFSRLVSNKANSKVGEWLQLPHERVKAIERYQSLLRNNKTGNTSFDAQMLMMIKYYLPGLLHQEDRMSMISSIESRVPFLDHRLVDLALKIPFYYKVRNGTLKYIFRDAMRGIVPDKVLRNKIKRGYPTPISIWAKDELYSFIQNHFNHSNVLSDSIINPKEVLNRLELHKKGSADYGSMLWSCLAMEIWFKANFN